MFFDLCVTPGQSRIHSITSSPLANHSLTAERGSKREETYFD